MSSGRWDYTDVILPEPGRTHQHIREGFTQGLRDSL